VLGVATPGKVSGGVSCFISGHAAAGRVGPKGPVYIGGDPVSYFSQDLGLVLIENEINDGSLR